ncbi:MAG: DUF427 domain-containing protein [Nocardioidaceae bacterium]
MRRPTPVQPGPGQESVWDYPRPPRLERTGRQIEVVLGGQVIASSHAALRVLETSHPPTYYLPMSCFVEGALRPAPGGSYCEWKGQASYLDLVGGEAVARQAAWFYPEPTAAYAEILDHVALYPGMTDRCTVDGEVVQPQPGGFYGGWVTSWVVGPFKGDPGTMSW